MYFPPIEVSGEIRPPQRSSDPLMLDDVLWLLCPLCSGAGGGGDCRSLRALANDLPSPPGMAESERVRSVAQTIAPHAKRSRSHRPAYLDDRLNRCPRNPPPNQVQVKKRIEPADHTLGRSRGGLTTKIHMHCDASGVLLHFLLSGGQASDISSPSRYWVM